MNEQKLKEWLHASEAAAAEPVLPRLDAGYLERLAARRRARRHATAAAGVAAALVALTVLATSPNREDTSPGATRQIAERATRSERSHPVDVETLERQLDALERKIDERRELVAALRHADELDRLNGELAAAEEATRPSVEMTAVRLRQLRYEAAAASLFYANALASDFGETDLAAAEYRTIVWRYPATVWADSAQRFLSSLSPTL